MIDPSLLLPYALIGAAKEHGDELFIEEVGGRSLTYGQTAEEIRRWAALLQELGVGPGDRVLSMLPPGVDAFCVWLGAAYLHALEVSVNTDYVGAMLRQSLDYSEPRVAVTSSSCLFRFDEVAYSSTLGAVVLVDGDQDATVRTVDAVRELARVEPLSRDPEIRQWHTSCVLLTSGTTGPSKGVFVPWGQVYAAATAMMDPAELKPGEGVYSALPFYHLIARMNAQLAASARARFVVRDRFSLTQFWDDIRTHNCVFAQALFGNALHDQPASPEDRENPLRVVMMAPISRDFREFGQRFGVEVRAGFGMTEIGIGILARGDIPDAETCGQAATGVAGYELRLVDAYDIPVPDGRPGELVIRTSEPWTLNAGYLGMPEATARAWRNGWFHTGDIFVRDPSGWFRFVDRLKDVIRRRGENVSSVEVEREVLAHPAVRECSAVAASVPPAEEEVKVVVVRVAGAQLDAPELIAFLKTRMPKFMLPRFVEFVDALPRAAGTLKVRKVDLRENALNENTWDRETESFIAESAA